MPYKGLKKEALAERVRAAREIQPAVESSPVVKLQGNELGQAKDMSDLRKRAARYAKAHFNGRTVTTKADGQAIRIPSKGIGKAVSGKRSADELKATVAIPAMLENSIHIDQSPDKHGDPNIKAVHQRAVRVDIAGQQRNFLLIVKGTNEGKRFYDRYVVQTKTPPVESEGLTGRPLPDSEAAGSSSTDSIGAPPGEVKPPRGTRAISNRVCPTFRGENRAERRGAEKNNKTQGRKKEVEVATDQVVSKGKQNEGKQNADGTQTAWIGAVLIRDHPLN